MSFTYRCFSICFHNELVEKKTYNNDLKPPFNTYFIQTLKCQVQTHIAVWTSWTDTDFYHDAHGRGGVYPAGVLHVYGANATGEY